MSRLPVYVASRASVPARAAMWRAYRAQGANIISTWIDEDGEGETDRFDELWTRIHNEISRCERLVFYAEELADFPLKGALVEAGMAIALGKEVWVVLGTNILIAGRTFKPIGSWIAHPRVTRIITQTTPLELAAAVGLEP